MKWAMQLVLRSNEYQHAVRMRVEALRLKEGNDKLSVFSYHHWGLET